MKANRTLEGNIVDHRKIVVSGSRLDSCVCGVVEVRAFVKSVIKFEFP
jgi:hypothetical protein